jgi:hypothetical protein
MDQHNVFRDDHVHVCARMCDTCIFHSGNRMQLKSGRVREMVDSARSKEGGTIVCHSTLDGNNAICRGYWDRFAQQDVLIRLAIVMNRIREITPPRKNKS